MSEDEDPVKLIARIEGVTHNFRDQQCTTGSMWHENEQLHNCVQKDDEDIKKHCDGFKNHSFARFTEQLKKDLAATVGFEHCILRTTVPHPHHKELHENFTLLIEVGESSPQTSIM